jgi:hypothetical protein
MVLSEVEELHVTDENLKDICSGTSVRIILPGTIKQFVLTPYLYIMAYIIVCDIFELSFYSSST